MATGYTGAYMGPLPISIGLRGVQTILDITETPVAVLEQPLAYARYMIAFARANTFLGSVDMINLPGMEYVFIQCSDSVVNDQDYSNHRFIILPNAYNGNRIKIEYKFDTNCLYVSCKTGVITSCIIRAFIIPAYHSGTNSYAIDNITANNPAPDSFITFHSPITTSYTGSNAFNLGQQTITQTNTDNVTINSSSGKIINNDFLLGPSGTVSYNVYNTSVSSNSIVNITVNEYGNNGLPYVYISNIFDGGFTVVIYNIGIQSITGKLVLGYILS